MLFNITNLIQILKRKNESKNTENRLFKRVWIDT